MGHAGDEWDVGEGVVCMAANSGKFVTGEVPNVDGGQQLGVTHGRRDGSNTSGYPDKRLT